MFIKLVNCQDYIEMHGQQKSKKKIECKVGCVLEPVWATTRRGTRWRSWLRHYATSRKVASSIPDGVIEIFHLRNPSGRTMALGLTHPLIEMSNRYISWGGGVVKAAGA